MSKNYDYTLDDFERVLRALPEKATDGDVTYMLKMGKTGDSTGEQSRYYVGYSNDNPSATLVWYEESSLFRAANKALGKIHGFKEQL